MGESSDEPSARRRTLLRSLAAGSTLASAGCLGRLRAATGWEAAAPVSLEIKSLPADADPYALRVARSAARWFRAAGLEVSVTPLAREPLYRQVLLRNDFDAFVAPLPASAHSGDGLYALLHSRFGSEPGWQNPFGYANLDVDDRLERQRTTDDATRREALAAVQRSVARTQPFSVVGFPDEIRAAGRGRFSGWHRTDFGSPLGYLGLDRPAGSGVALGTSTEPEGTDETTLRLVTTDRRPTGNLNPLAVEFRRTGVLTGLLYDPLGYETGSGDVEPWLAEGWEFVTAGAGPRARVRLRPEAVWHDGEPLTAADVAFTYALLADVTLGRDGERADASSDGDGTAAGGDGSSDGTATSDRSTDRSAGDGASADGATPVTAPRFRGRSSLVSGARAVDRRTVEIDFADCTPSVATRAFTVPVLPEHVWRERSGPASVGGVDVGSATEVLVTNNVPPVGSGPFAFQRNVPGDRLVLERFDEHFLAVDPPAGLPGGVGEFPPFDRIDVAVVGSDDTAVSMVTGGDADVTDTPVGADTIPRIGRARDVDLVVDRSATPYVVGYNTRRPPLTNPRFRNTLGHLIDQAWLAAEVFAGYARPAVSPLAGTGLVPDDLRWDEEDPVTPFIGSNGTVDAEAARSVFREAGYGYEGETLVERG